MNEIGKSRVLRLSMAATVLGTIAVSACSSSDSTTTAGSSSFALSGTLNKSSYAVLKHGFKDRLYALFFGGNAIATATTVDKLWAIPIYKGTIRPYDVADAKTGTINSDGTFSLSLPIQTDRDWAVLLIDSTQTNKYDQVVGYVSMTDASNRGLLQMPTSKAQTSGMDLGTLTKDGNQTSSTKTVSDNAANFSGTVSQLQELAKTGDLLKSAKNIYINYDASAGTFVGATNVFSWYDSDTNVGSKTMKNKFYATTSDEIAAFVKNKSNGFGLSFSTNLPALAYSKVCTKTVKVELFPPKNVTRARRPNENSTQTPIGAWIGGAGCSTVSNTLVANCYGSSGWGSDTTTDKPYTTISTNPVGADGEQGNYCAVGDLDVMKFQGTSGEISSISLDGGGYPDIPAGGIPSGYWIVKADGTEIARFDQSIANPFEGGDTSKPSIYIPVPKVTVDASNNITAISIKWYLRNDTTYEEVTDFTIIKELLGTSGSGSLNVGLTRYSGTKVSETFNPTPGEDITVSSTKGWKYFNDSSGQGVAVDSIRIDYATRGTSFGFDFRDYTSSND